MGQQKQFSVWAYRTYKHIEPKTSIHLKHWFFPIYTQFSNILSKKDGAKSGHLGVYIYVYSYLSFFYAMFYYLCSMFIITLLFPNACIVGFEYIEESEEFYFNELNFYFFVFAIAYRWRSDGEDIGNLEL